MKTEYGMNRHGRRAAQIALAVLATVLLPACATAPANKDQVVIDRAQERWEAIISGDLEKAYTYYSPGYRSANSLIDFGVEMRTRRVGYTSVEYVEHECGDSRCTVRSLVGYIVIAPIPGMTKYEGKQLIEDTWVKTSGQWWYLPKN